MIYDLVEWFAMPSTKTGYKLANGTVYGRETHHLEGVKLDGVTPAEFEYHNDTGYSLQFIKGQKGFPWDIKPYDDDFIYDRVTELDWTSPRDFKQFNPQLAMCPRFWDGTQSQFPILHSTSNYEVWINCAKVAAPNPNTVGAVRYRIENGPAEEDFGGDVGVVQVIVLNYDWNGFGNPINYQFVEELHLCREVGWVKWILRQWMNGAYQIVDATLHNKIMPGGAPLIQFPCLSIP